MSNSDSQNRGTQGALFLFVYGTLKQGFWNHDRFCRGALYIEEASVRGQLYELPSGIPILRVPNSDILAVGTSDPLADVVTLDKFAEKLEAKVREDRDAERWQMVQGELVVFPDPLSALPPIDRLEGFRPGYSSLYNRVLLPVVTKSGIQLAWCYVSQGPLPGNASLVVSLKWRLSNQS